MDRTRSRLSRKRLQKQAFALLCALSVCWGFSGCENAAVSPGGTEQAAARPSAAAKPVEATRVKGIPRLVDLGAGKCIPCKKMAPILEELKKEYAGSLEVVFIDVWKDPRPAEEYGVETIPTQIFFDPSGKELFRHEGFFAKEDILAKWRELGFVFDMKPGSTGN